MLSTYTLVEFFLFSFFIWLIIDNRQFKKVIAAVSTLFIIFICYYFFTTKWNFFDSVPVACESILIFTFSLYYLFEQINKPRVLFIYNTSMFWIILGFLVYLAGSFFIYTFADNLDRDDRVKFWFIPFIFNTIKNIFFSIAFSRREAKDKNSSSLSSSYDNFFKTPFNPL
ncbi:FlaA1/EpsC-like NDP-sugar epimerase [Chitinophagaceae bacterium OAS944]|nr:FlaA1/EpsC-like NDP-sugar epimerase [Chitinophagaceae bacterium OAS944]